MAPRKIIPAVPVVNTPSGTNRVEDSGSAPSKKPLKVKKTSREDRQPPVTPSNGTPKRSPAPLDKNPKRRRRAPKKHICPDSGSETDDLDSDAEAEWAGGAGPTNLRLVSRELRNQLVCHEERPLDEVVKPEATAEGIEAGTDGSSPSLNTFTWSADFSTFSGKREEYLNTPGPRVDAKDPLGLFLEVWDKDIIGLIVRETNEYAWQTICKLSEADCLTENLKEWEETTVEEIYRFFAVLNYMSIDYRSRVDEYWTTGILGMPQFRSIMPRNRFNLLMRFLHFVDNYVLHARSYEKKISKIAPIVDHCNRKFCSMYTPQAALSLDESLLLWKGRLAWAQCIRAKAARFGIKTFELCEARSGYLLRSFLYAGKNSSMTPGTIDGFNSTPAKMVLELMDGFLDVGHMLVMDNWYNQLPLTRYLKQRRTDVIGTMNRRRTHVPPAIKTANEIRMSRGEQIARHCGDITVIAWKDVKLVTIISTFHNDEQVGFQRGKVEMRKPVLVDCYNRNMGGVDMKDQKLSMFLFERKRGNKWYIKVFKRILNTSILNTYIIYTRFAENTPLNHRDFRYKLSESLLSTFKSVEVPRPVTIRASKREGLAQIRLIRNEKHDHFPIFTEAKEANAAHHKRSRCDCCLQRGKRATTTTFCRTCKVPLCTTCWVDYHTLLKL